jgi:hypothetical protein
MRYLPDMVGTIERRLLVNYRVDPNVLQRVLPEPFRPQLVAGVGVAGICLIRLANLRPEGVPHSLGLTTENAAHRVAVEWDRAQGVRRGVYIPRRDTSSRLTALVGGRLFPGEHSKAHFSSCDVGTHHAVEFTSCDGTARVALSVEEVKDLPGGSVFASMNQASAFFENGSLGYSATRHPGLYQGIELCGDDWSMTPMRTEHLESSWFGDDQLFPPGSAELDSTFLMSGISATWKARGELTSQTGSAEEATRCA